MWQALLGFAIDGIRLIPSGKGKRKAAVKYLQTESAAIETLVSDLNKSADAGEVIGGFSLRMLAQRLLVTKSMIDTTVEAIGDDTPEENKN